MSGPIVEAEEDIYAFEPANNGAGPTWCCGSSCIARVGNDLFVSGLETIPGAKPLSNCLPTLFHRSKRGWEMVYRGQGRTREPAPIACWSDSSLWLSITTTLTAPDVYDGPAEPQVLRFSTTDPSAEPEVLPPVWEESAAFRPHTYRSFAADGLNKRLFLSYNVEYELAQWSFMDESERWTSNGILDWPVTTDFGDPLALRICYAASSVRDGEVHFVGAAPLWEPVAAWHEFKMDKGLTLRPDWDYVFRRLYYSATPDVTQSPFAPWLLLTRVEELAGHAMHCDLSVAADGSVHVLWIEKNIEHGAMRDAFFPDEKLTVSLNYCVIENSRVSSRRVILGWTEGSPGPVPTWARFHRTEDGRLFVLYACRLDSDSFGRSEYRLQEIGPQSDAAPMSLDLEAPLRGWFFTAGPRGGNRPSDVIDVLGERSDAHVMRYARLRVG